MPAFHYIAIDKQGQEHKGVIEAESVKHARKSLRDQSLIPLHVEETEYHRQATNRVKNFSAWLKPRRLTAKTLALITRQWATLLSAGLPLEEVLGAAAEQAESAYIKSLTLSIRAKVLEGHSFATALREQAERFSNLYCATIAAGEKSGHLDKVLNRLADYTEQQAQFKQKLTTALIYPSMIILVAVSIVGFLLEYVVPKMVSVYSDMNQNLPWMTSFLISLSETIKTYGWYGVLLLVIIVFSVRFVIKKSDSFRFKFHWFLLRIPLLAYLIKTTDTARFSRTLAILSSSGVSLLDAMSIASRLIVMLPIRQAVEQAVTGVREGKSIHACLKKTTYFSPMSIHMVASGEASGQLDGMLARVAKMQEDDVVRLIELGLALFEPFIILVMGAVILFIVLAVLLPIFQLNQIAM